MKFITLYVQFHFNLFSTNIPLLYPLKTSENVRFSDFFRGYKSGALVEYELIGLIKPLLKNCSSPEYYDQLEFHVYNFYLTH